MTEAEKAEHAHLAEIATSLIPDSTIEQLRTFIAMRLHVGFSPMAQSAVAVEAPRQRKKSIRNRNGLAARITKYMLAKPEGASESTINRELKAAGLIKVSTTDQDVLAVLKKNSRQYRNNDATGLWQHIKFIQALHPA